MTASPALRRISFSLPADLQREFDRVLRERGFDNRSQALAEMIRSEIAAHRMQRTDAVVAGTLTLFYDESKRGLQGRLASLQRRFVAEVISSQHVLLENHQRMEILVVQGPVRRLQAFVDACLAVRGVQTGKLDLTPALLPPVHPRRPGRRAKTRTRKSR